MGSDGLWICQIESNGSVKMEWEYVSGVRVTLVRLWKVVQRWV